jgi:NADP-dependent 3-hydroxy acid dehydrogenase YdfG
LEPLANQTAVITGASSGIGEAIALAVAEEGAKVCLIGRSARRLQIVAQNARTEASKVLTYQADLTIEADIQKLVERLQEETKQVDMLIHSAGIISLGRMDRTPVEKLDWQYRTNVRAPYILTQALLPMLRMRRGQIVFINSTMGLRARGTVGQYAATKHALKAIADALRDELNAEGVRVLSVFAGRTATPMQEMVHGSEGATYQPERLMQPDDVAGVVVNALKLPRTAEITDITVRPMTKL